MHIYACLCFIIFLPLLPRNEQTGLTKWSIYGQTMGSSWLWWVIGHKLVLEKEPQKWIAQVPHFFKFDKGGAVGAKIIPNSSLVCLRD